MNIIYITLSYVVAFIVVIFCVVLLKHQGIEQSFAYGISIVVGYAVWRALTQMFSERKQEASRIEDKSTSKSESESESESESIREIHHVKEKPSPQRNNLFSEKILNFLSENVLSIGTIDEFKKGQKDFDNWGGGVITGSKEWIVNKLSAKLLEIKAGGLNSISCPKDYGWQTSKLEGFTVRIEVSIPSGMLAGYYIGRIGDDLFGLFGYSFDHDETEKPPE